MGPLNILSVTKKRRFFTCSKSCTAIAPPHKLVTKNDQVSNDIPYPPPVCSRPSPVPTAEPGTVNSFIFIPGMCKELLRLALHRIDRSTTSRQSRASNVS